MLKLFYTWNEPAEEFPNKWIVVEDAEIDEFAVVCCRGNKNINYERAAEGSGAERTTEQCRT